MKKKRPFSAVPSGIWRRDALRASREDLLTLKIEYDSRLIEQAVAHATFADPQLEAELHRRTDPVYDLPPSSDRDARFLRIYGGFFERLRGL